MDIKILQGVLKDAFVLEDTYDAQAKNNDFLAKIPRGSEAQYVLTERRLEEHEGLLRETNVTVIPETIASGRTHSASKVVCERQRANGGPARGAKNLDEGEDLGRLWNLGAVNVSYFQNNHTCADSFFKGGEGTLRERYTNSPQSPQRESFGPHTPRDRKHYLPVNVFNSSAAELEEPRNRALSAGRTSSIPTQKKHLVLRERVAASAAAAGSSAKRTQELVDLHDAHDAHAESARRWDVGRGQAEVMLLNTRQATMGSLEKDELERELLEVRLAVTRVTVVDRPDGPQTQGQRGLAHARRERVEAEARLLKLRQEAAVVAHEERVLGLSKVQMERDSKKNLRDRQNFREKLHNSRTLYRRNVEEQLRGTQPLLV